MNSGKQLFSKITSEGQLELSLAEVEIPSPKAGEVLVRMEAAPINPSDMWPMFGPADLSKAALQDNDGGNVMSAPLFDGAVAMMKSRLDQALPIGNEGAGTVIEAGEGAEGLLGKVVGLSSGASYATHCCVPAMTCLPLNDGTTALEGASSFVNPLTALGFVETMRLEGHTAIVHTAAASNLGQMLVKLCKADNVPLVNIVRKQEQVDLLQEIGAENIVNSSSDSYRKDLYQAIASTGATLGFDAIGGGEAASDILATMEMILSKDATGLNTYGSETLKQVYVYGGLDIGPTVLKRSYGMKWAVSGWLMPHLLQRVGLERVGEFRKRIADEIGTTFASKYTAELSLKDVITPEIVAQYNAKKTGEKYIVNPSKDF